VDGIDQKIKVNDADEVPAIRSNDSIKPNAEVESPALGGEFLHPTGDDKYLQNE